MEKDAAALSAMTYVKLNPIPAKTMETSVVETKMAETKVAETMEESD